MVRVQILLSLLTRLVGSQCFGKSGISRAFVHSPVMSLWSHNGGFCSGLGKECFWFEWVVVVSKWHHAFDFINVMVGQLRPDALICYKRWCGRDTPFDYFHSHTIDNIEALRGFKLAQKRQQPSSPFCLFWRFSLALKNWTRLSPVWPLSLWTWAECCKFRVICHYLTYYQSLFWAFCFISYSILPHQGCLG